MEGLAQEMPEKLEIIVKTVNNNTFHLNDVDSDSMISDLKHLIQEATTIEASRQRLIYRGHVMEDTNSIQQYHFESGHTIHMVTRPENLPPRTSQTEDNPPSREGTRRLNTLGTSTFPLGLLNPLLNLPGMTRANNAEITFDSSLEHVRQGILTMNTLMSTISPAAQSMREYGMSSTPEVSAFTTMETTEDGSKARRVGNIVQDGDKHFYIGQWIDVKDTVNQWLAATVMDMDYSSRRLFVHFNGWPVRWDEWIDWDSSRIAPFRSYTSQETNAFLSPSLTTRETSSLTTGRDDVRLLIPEVSALMRNLQPLLQRLSDLSQESLLNEPAQLSNISSTEQNMPWMRHFEPQESQRGLMIGDTSADIQMLATELSPLLDRFGRVLSDISPHIRALSEPPPQTAEVEIFPANSSSQRYLKLTKFEGAA